MKVSIVFPVYNKEPQIERSIGSAYAQTYQDIEVIAVDDGSTDDSLRCLRGLANRFPQLIVHPQSNGGPSLARNAGLSLATGSYVMFHDADDVLEPEAISKLMEVATHLNCDIVGGVSRRNLGHREWIISKFQHVDLAMDFQRDAEKALKYCTNFSPCNKLYRREFLIENDLKFTPHLYMQDIEFWIKAMFLSKNTSQLDCVVSTYFYYENSTSRERSPKRFNSLPILFDNLSAFFEAHGLQSMLHVRNIALLQGALMFFTRWKLSEWKVTGDSSDLERIRALLVQIPEQDFLRFFVSVNRNGNAPILLLVRGGHYETAYQAEIALQKCLSAASRLAKRTLRLLPTQSISADRLQYLARSATKKSGYFTTVASLVEKLNWRPYASGGWESGKEILDVGRRGVGRAGRIFVGSWLRSSRVVGRLKSRVRVLPADREEKSKHLLVFGLGNLCDIGGVQLSYQHLFEHLCNAGFTITFFTHHMPDPAAKPYYRFPESVRICHYDLDDTWYSKEKIAHAAQAADPDVVLIVNSGQPALILASALYDHSAPVVFSERGGTEHCLMHNWATRMQRELVHFASDFSHVLMPSYRNGAPAWLSEYVSVIPSLTEPAHQHASPNVPGTDGRYKILYTGRLSFEKDIDLLLKAFAGLAEEYSDWDISLFGDGPDRASLESLADEIGIADRVTFHGSTTSYAALSDAYCCSHLFVLPSRAEGCPLSLREAMAHGLPVIGYDNCSGTNEIIVDGRNGLLAQSSDKVSGLRESMARLLSNAELRCALAASGIEDVKQYAPERTLSAWEELLRHASNYKGKREQLRAEKSAKNPGGYARLRRVFEATRQQRATRNIFAFDMGIRTGEFRPEDVKPYFLLFGSCLFDPFAYGKQNPNVKLMGIDPLYHYIVEGWKADNLPANLFDQEWYVKTYMNGASDVCPLVHFYEIGRHNQFQPSPAPTLATLRRIERELSADGDIAVDFASLSKEQIVSELMNRLTWKRIDFRQLSHKAPLSRSMDSRLWAKRAVS